MLLSLGLCTVALAGVLIVLAITSQNRALLRYALYYMIAAAVFMSLRALLLELKQRRKRRIRRAKDRCVAQEPEDA